MGFTGFGDESFAFYEGLLADNSRSYWAEHRETYERHVRAPMAELCAELEDEFGAAKIFRPYRDVRFSKDKTPYKTHQGAITEQGFYVEIDADGILVAGGMYMPGTEQLHRYRAAVDEDLSGKPLAAIVEGLRDAGLEVNGDVLKTRPRGTPPDHPRLELLRHRSLYASAGWPADPWTRTPEVVERVRSAWRTLRPLMGWFDQHVGPSDLVR
ncbi:DUF2461 domain-containing protein [Actinomadura kijaniata]|uniref:Uncharacterized protein (TIGR02453 family) n=1 Tax=Actinomadura namibiensis TaxID=182080 RepID=A0A7W3LJN0_ACTNM|nr:DUF2461 domain-containing protein [Actinomadura namibiensis]MBA8949262.1 uncharacterized protein (TIGR02453 family) [Actinomadura namibiensis]